MKKPRVTVYIPCHNYGRFLRDAVDSVLAQHFDDWELIIVDDGSTDDTARIAEACVARYPDQIRVIRNHRAKGLQAGANAALEAARGDYIMRLDADDYLDENALLVLATYLDRHPDVGLVYPNYVYVNEVGDVLGVENRKKVGSEAKFLDLPAHGACTMVRKRVLKSVGGYSESYNAQDGHEIWLKILHRYHVGNVSTPLFYYRQHGTSLSRDEARLLQARQKIKRDLVERHEGKVRPRSVAVIPAKNTYRDLPNVVLNEVAGRPLIDYTLATARAAGAFEAVCVTTDDPAVAEYCAKFPGVTATVRPAELSRRHAGLSDVVTDAVARFEKEDGIYGDIVVVLSVHSPLRRAEHIRMALDTLLLYNADSVISVYEDYDIHFAHGEHGLEPINRNMLHRLRVEREALHVDNGAIKALWRDVLNPDDLYGRRVGHVVMPYHESYQIKSPFDLWLVEQVLLRRAEAATVK